MEEELTIDCLKSSNEYVKELFFHELVKKNETGGATQKVNSHMILLLNNIL